MSLSNGLISFLWKFRNFGGLFVILIRASTVSYNGIVLVFVGLQRMNKMIYWTSDYYSSKQYLSLRRRSPILFPSYPPDGCTEYKSYVGVWSTDFDRWILFSIIFSSFSIFERKYDDVSPMTSSDSFFIISGNSSNILVLVIWVHLLSVSSSKAEI